MDIEDDDGTWWPLLYAASAATAVDVGIPPCDLLSIMRLTVLSHIRDNPQGNLGFEPVACPRIRRIALGDVAGGRRVGPLGLDPQDLELFKKWLESMPLLEEVRMKVVLCPPTSAWRVAADIFRLLCAAPQIRRIVCTGLSGVPLDEAARLAHESGKHLSVRVPHMAWPIGSGHVPAAPTGVHRICDLAGLPVSQGP